jgi:hypothetical protein
VNEKPNANETKEALISTVEQSFDLKQKAIATEEKDSISHQVAEEDEEESQMDEMANEVADTIMESIENETIESFIEQPFDELEKLFGEVATKVKDDVQEVEKQKTPTLEEELQDTLPVDVAAELFEKVVPKSLNDQLQTNIQIGLNDRIIFVKNLFHGSQEDFNRVISQLNTHKSAKEAKKFINKMVKPDYDWKEHEALEIRFMEIIARRFA